MTLTLTDDDLTYFWLGPLGYQQQLPLLPVKGTTDASEELIGAVLTSLAGGLTLDVFSVKRTWQLDWVCLTQAETAAVAAWFLGLTDSPLRLVDPRAGNWLTRDGSTGGSYSRTATAHTATAGILAYAAVSDYPALFAGMVDGGIAWSVPGSTAATLRIDAGLKVPLIPGQAVTITVWVKGTLGAQIGVQFYNTAGAAGSTSLNSSVTLAGWTAYTRTFTPTSGQVSASLIVVAASGTARTLTIGPALWHPTNTDWVPGVGCPQVLPTARKTTYPGLANQDISVTLREV